MRATRMQHRLRPLAVSAAAAAGALAVLAALAAAESAPRFSTGSASPLSGTTGQLEGVVVPMGKATSYLFEYGPTAEKYPAVFPNKTKLVAVPLPATGTKDVKVGQSVTGLAPGYRYRIVGYYTNAKNELVTVPGGERTLKARITALKFASAKGAENRISTVYGGTAELTGSLSGTGSAHHTLTVQETPYPFTEGFTTLPGTLLTNSAGAFSYEATNLKRSTEFRFVTVDSRPVLGPAMTVHVTPRVTLHVRRGGKTSLYRLYGTVTPARNGASLAIQELLPQKATSRKEGPRASSIASTVLKRLSSKSSRFSVIVQLSGSFYYQAYVHLVGGSLESGHSSHVLIKAPAATTNRKK